MHRLLSSAELSFEFFGGKFIFIKNKNSMNNKFEIFINKQFIDFYQFLISFYLAMYHSESFQ
jgi:hypothetical protein